MSFVVTRKPAAMSRKALATLGAGRLAYVRAHRSEDVGFLHAEAPLLPPGRIVFVLHGADGCPLVIAESREAAISDAEVQAFEAVSLH